MSGPGESNPELESFRERWKAEVRAKKPTSTAAPAPGPSSSPALATALKALHKPPTAPAKKQVHPPADQDEDDDFAPPPPVFDQPGTAPDSASSAQHGESLSTSAGKKPVSALEYYEQAVEREVVGRMGDSLTLYRKAFRMDDAVDQKYKAKHFPKPATKPAAAAGSRSDGSAAVASSAATAAPKRDQPQSLNDLIPSFSGLSIEPASPEIEGMPAPPCPISCLPDEILVHILRDVAIHDVGDFMRLAQVCRRLAYLVLTEDQIWRRVCLGSEFGFGGMHYHWQRQVAWEPLTTEDLLREAAIEEEEGATTDLLPLTLEQRAQKHAAESLANTMAFYEALYSSSWQRMFRLRPRIRFNGCYICTVNYIRPGQASSNQFTWNSPVHIVTYYRYLRFFRDGSVLSLLTTAEPADVVHHLTREAAALHAGGAAAHLPSIVVQSVLKGRWRLATLADNPAASVSEAEGDLVVETEGVSKYIYRLDLSLRSGGRSTGPKNNKLVWRGFYSFNRLTGDVAEFALGDRSKPFTFSRVKSYGVRGE
ncbi:hypothetical protein B0T19DRAFT_350329 [Cercophora scortea]|uniref:F-box domain-containing protein n=1 Tax=Cercophora scortea TaxID=314031 RepID=A0AAE0MLG7_9PEZI|nr:hypothetical protein B0T19DRAFT_350329 [Cercophora scortea]